MKKAILLVFIFIMISALVLAGCGRKSQKGTDEPDEPEKQEEERTHTIEFDGLQLEIPARLELNETASGDNYRTYDYREKNMQQESIMITSINSAVKFGEYYTLEDAAKSMKDMTEKIDNRSDVTGAVIQPEGFDGKYNVISLSFKETIADQVSYVKYAYIYCDDRTFALTYKNKEEDYSVYDEFMKTGVYVSGKGGDNKDDGDKMQKISAEGMSTEIPAEWKYSKEKSNDNAKYYIGDDFRFVLSFADTGSKVTDQKLGEYTDKVLESSGDEYKGMSYYDYTVGNGINAKIVYVDKEKSNIGKYERLVVFAKGSVVFIVAGDCDNNDFGYFDSAMRNVKL